MSDETYVGSVGEAALLVPPKAIPSLPATSDFDFVAATLAVNVSVVAPDVAWTQLPPLLLFDQKYKVPVPLAVPVPLLTEYDVRVPLNFQLPLRIHTTWPFTYEGCVAVLAKVCTSNPKFARLGV
jgi:hypothetical protein